MPRNIALIGRMRSGKDSTAERLVSEHGYTRLAFADPLREMALRLNPIVGLHSAPETRLGDVVRVLGWDGAKEQFPEVRRVLQHIGQGVRDLDPDFWLRGLKGRYYAAQRAKSAPVVITDVRYRNEVVMLEALGFATVRVTRPSSGAAVTMSQVRAALISHRSETELDGWPCAYQLRNDGTLADLASDVDLMVPYL